MRGFLTAADGPFPHLLLEHLEGPTLQSLLERHGPVGLEQLLPLGLHVASALHYCAREDVLHLDVKPENLVMGAPPRLIDFSVARTTAQAGRLRKAIGTDAYMAPGAVRGGRGRCRDRPAGRRVRARRDAAARADRRAGVPAGHRGRPLQRPGGALPPARARARRAPAPYARAAAELLRAMLARRPAERPSAAEVAGALEPVVAELPRRLVLSRRGWRRR